jgi:hypothetical protein
MVTHVVKQRCESQIGPRLCLSSRVRLDRKPVFDSQEPDYECSFLRLVSDTAAVRLTYWTWKIL